MPNSSVSKRPTGRPGRRKSRESKWTNQGWQGFVVKRKILWHGPKLGRGKSRSITGNRRTNQAMKEATKRWVFRWVHMVCGVPMLGYIYDSPANTANYAFIVRYVFLPVLLVSGLWMWKGHVVRRLLSRTPTSQDTVAKIGA